MTANDPERISIAPIIPRLVNLRVPVCPFLHQGVELSPDTKKKNEAILSGGVATSSFNIAFSN